MVEFKSILTKKYTYYVSYVFLEQFIIFFVWWRNVKLIWGGFKMGLLFWFNLENEGSAKKGRGVFWFRNTASEGIKDTESWS